MRWLTGQMPHRRCTATGTSQYGRPADEDLEAAKLDDVQPDLMDAILVVEQDRHFAVALDPGDRLDGDAAKLVGATGRFRG